MKLTSSFGDGLNYDYVRIRYEYNIFIIILD